MRLYLKCAATSLVATFITFAALAIAPAAVTAHSVDAGDITITHPWTRPTIGDVMVGAVYVVIGNDGEQADKLLSVQSDVADRVEVHETVKEGDVAKMRAINGGIEIPADDSIVMEPLGKHIMLFGVKQKLKVGETFPLKFVFERAGEIAIDVKVERPASAATSKGEHMHGGSHRGH